MGEIAGTNLFILMKCFQSEKYPSISIRQQEKNQVFCGYDAENLLLLSHVKSIKLPIEHIELPDWLKRHDSKDENKL